MTQLKTNCHGKHVALGGNMVDFHGWSLPLHYGSQLAEHEAVRAEVGIFDVSHMGLLDAQGKDAELFLRYLLAFDVSRLQPGRAQYGCLLNHDAGIIDDIICYRLDTGYRLIVNAARSAYDLSWMQQRAEDYSVQITMRDDLSLLAVQGPAARQLMAKLSPWDELSVAELTPFKFLSSGDSCLACTGYSGEDGFEIMLPNSQVENVWQQIVDAGATPCGLAARDSLRLEAGLNLYGQDMDEITKPWQVGLHWTVHLKDEQRDFIGRQAYAASRCDNSASSNAQDTVTWRQVGLLALSPGVLRAKQQVLLRCGTQGVITSASYSPQLLRGLALAKVPEQYYQALQSGEAITAVVKQKKREMSVQLVLPPFVRKGVVQPAIKKYIDS